MTLTLNPYAAQVQSMLPSPTRAARLLRVYHIFKALNPLPCNMPALEPEQVDGWLAICAEVLAGKFPTMLHVLIDRRLSRPEIEYLVRGKVGA